MSTIYRYDSNPVLEDIGRLVVELGSLTNVAAKMPGVSISFLSQVMRGQVPPSPKILDFLGYDRLINVKYSRH